MGRVLGIDLGTRRIGVAVSDTAGLLASPHVVVERSGDTALDHRRLAAIVEELGAERVVVGLPLSMSGADGPAATKARAEIALLERRLDVPVEAQDERLSTVMAHQGMAAAGVRSKKRRTSVDAVAAAVLLQGWLDRQAGAPGADAPSGGADR